MNFSQKLIISLVVLTVLLSGCSNSTWDGGEFAGQSVYDLPNKRFSTAAIDALKTCGLSDNNITTLAEQLIPDVKEVSGSISNISDVVFTDVSSGQDIASFSLKELNSDIFEITCTSLP